VGWYAYMAIPYYQSTYYKDTHKLFLLGVVLDKGAYGEYLTFKCLKKYEKDGAKFLFNCYLPKKENETSEIDVMMIFQSGIYVFESKNYSGWIFGSEKNKTWTQSLPSGRKSVKEKFYNPIMQNRTHVKWLRKQIGDQDPISNIVVFSERCELKKVEVTSTDVWVVKRNNLSKTVKKLDQEIGNVLSDERISEIYDQLYPFTQVSNEVKEQHVQDIEENYK
jgi:hypothetical protein